jgi:hypothetical protein
MISASALLAASTLLVSAPIYADEGMWQPAQLPSLAPQLKHDGLVLDPKQLSSLASWPLDSVISLGFCTASFVSPDGLIVTNHHCGMGALQYNSTPQKNLIETGFLAHTQAEELPADPTQRVYVTDQLTDVTEQVDAAVKPGMDGYQRFVAIDQARKKIVRDCEQPGYRCDVNTFSGGYDYQLVRKKEIRDVRIVYAPPLSIGEYGGEVDNWQWPRHDGDFSFLRAYVAKDGSTATYSKDNVPYRPKHWLTVNPNGVRAGDFVMVAGYPGSTDRHRTADELQDTLDWEYPTDVADMKNMLGIIDAASKRNADIGVRYADTVMVINNSMQFFEGNLEALTRGNALAAKRAQEADLDQWLAAQKADGKLDSTTLQADVSKLRQLVDAHMKFRERKLILDQLDWLGQAYTAAYQIVRLADEKRKPDLDREDGFQQRDEIRLLGEMQQMDRRYDPGVDQQMFVYILQEYVKLPANERLHALDRWLGGARDQAALANKVAALYAGSKLNDVKTRVSLLSATPEQLAASKDTWIVLMRSLMPDLLAIEHEEKTYDGDEAAARAGYMKALVAYSDAHGLPVYHDANSSLRVTFGTVQGYRPRDGVDYQPFTTVNGIVQKNTGKAPFNAPDAELAAIHAKAFDGFAGASRDALPVDFLSNLDITGGNSGSPTLDGNGKLVGLAFDGTWEGIGAGWLFDPEMTRSIHVDTPYMLWVMHHLDHADNLLVEMGVKIPD